MINKINQKMTKNKIITNSHKPDKYLKTDQEVCQRYKRKTAPKNRLKIVSMRESE